MSTSLSAIVTMLSSITMFKSLERELLEEIARRCSIKEYPPTETIISHGESSKAVYFIVSGQVRATMFTAQGREVSYQDLEAGNMFGELAAIDGEPRSTHVIAMQPVSLLRMSGEDFIDILALDSRIAQATLMKMAGLIRYLCGRIYNYGALSVNSRVRAELVRLATTGNVATERGLTGAMLIKNMPKHQELANRLATRREAVTKELRALEKAGIVSKDNGSLLVHSIEELQSMIED